MVKIWDVEWLKLGTFPRVCETCTPNPSPFSGPVKGGQVSEIQPRTPTRLSHVPLLFSPGRQITLKEGLTDQTQVARKALGPTT